MRNYFIKFIALLSSLLFLVFLSNNLYSQVKFVNYKGKDIIGIKKLISNDSLEITTFENEKLIISKYEYLKEVNLLANLILYSGLEMKGKIIDFDEVNYYFNYENELKTIPKELVKEIEFKKSNDEIERFYNKAIQKESVVKEIVLSYNDSNIASNNDTNRDNIVLNEKEDIIKPTAIGLAIGTPGFINLVMDYKYISNYGVNVALGYFDGSRGFQINNYYTLFNSNNFTHNIGIPIGIYKIDGKNWEYMGLAYSMQLYILHLQLGITYGQGDLSNPNVIGQLGVVFRF